MVPPPSPKNNKPDLTKSQTQTFLRLTRSSARQLAYIRTDKRLLLPVYPPPSPFRLYVNPLISQLESHSEDQCLNHLLRGWETSSITPAKYNLSNFFSNTVCRSLILLCFVQLATNKYHLAVQILPDRNKLCFSLHFGIKTSLLKSFKLRSSLNSQRFSLNAKSPLQILSAGTVPSHSRFVTLQSFTILVRQCLPSCLKSSKTFSSNIPLFQ